jgi:hypothetical protein
MTQETKSNLIDLTIFIISIAFILSLWAFGQSVINQQKSKYIQEVECDGQGK